ncbi:hypothetical protein M378DRAFT_171508 [Amanita muscaria Koide BX008]|uniref:Uncharacterized protein n=1 Tax=Amanita muscaria (strain Koide BX008) TaxID=946122 RepID=A0A0C2S4P9_AMAMK|nr:hypothetical protein M378DRAFT_171508 [Amanita muscaria Koide BX008]
MRILHDALTATSHRIDRSNADMLRRSGLSTSWLVTNLYILLFHKYQVQGDVA